MEPRGDLTARVYAAVDGVLVSNVKDRFAATFVIAHWIGLPIEKVGYVNSTVFPAGLSFLVEVDVFMDWGVQRTAARADESQDCLAGLRHVTAAEPGTAGRMRAIGR